MRPREQVCLTSRCFKLGDVDCVVKDGACWLADRSALAGSAARMIDLVRTMVREVGVPLHEAIGMATLNPARTLQLKEKGRSKWGRMRIFVVSRRSSEVCANLSRGRGDLSRGARILAKKKARDLEDARSAG